MYLENALKIKNEISCQLLQKRQLVRCISFANTDASAYRIESLPGFINGAGIIQNSNGDYTIKLLTKESMPVSLRTLQLYYGVQQHELFCEEVGEITLKGKKIIPPGSSIAHYNVTAGTLGCYVNDNRGNIYILSNNHVLADSDKGSWKDPVLSPGPEDGGTLANSIAGLSYVVPFHRKGCNYMDAALAKIHPDIKVETLVNNNFHIEETSTPALKQRVEKFGRTTGHTIGEITTTHLDVNVEFEGMQLEFHDQFEIKGLFSGGVRRKFCNDGDSGSIILEKKTHNAVGLLFAGTKNGTTFASPINNVLSALSVNIL